MDSQFCDDDADVVEEYHFDHVGTPVFTFLRSIEDGFEGYNVFRAAQQTIAFPSVHSALTPPAHYRGWPHRIKVPAVDSLTNDYFMRAETSASCFQPLPSREVYAMLGIYHRYDEIDSEWATGRPSASVHDWLEVGVGFRGCRKKWMEALSIIYAYLYVEWLVPVMSKHTPRFTPGLPSVVEANFFGIEEDSAFPCRKSMICEAVPSLTPVVRIILQFDPELYMYCSETYDANCYLLDEIPFVLAGTAYWFLANTFTARYRRFLSTGVSEGPNRECLWHAAKVYFNEAYCYRGCDCDRSRLGLTCSFLDLAQMRAYGMGALKPFYPQQKRWTIDDVYRQNVGDFFLFFNDCMVHCNDITEFQSRVMFIIYTHARNLSYNSRLHHLYYQTEHFSVRHF